MLSPRSKIIILITGSVIVFILLIGTIFGWWRKGPSAPAPESELQNVDLSFLQDQTAVEGQVFDESNASELAAALGGDVSTESVSPLEQEARSLARFFIERFGTYSTDARFANLDDLRSFMTPSMQRWAERYKKEQPPATGYSAITTEVAGLERESGSAPSGRIGFKAVTNRSEGGGEPYQQAATIELLQDLSGEWRVNGLFWGEKL